ncbi:MAG: bifunctional aldolase/short-chain dehydrogenase [Deltaproteobacteria bacterium]|nr:bifunctional aldolase/short-chain dehydrogenase [Deltaproteobacteria bacterium]
MQNRWSDDDARAFVARYGATWGEDLALRTYASRLIGTEPTLVLHGGGNTSVKGTARNVFSEEAPALFIKASGHDLATIEPGGHVAVDLEFVRSLARLDDLPDEGMVNALRTHLFDHRAATPSIETPVHAFLPGRFVDHTHADAVLALTNQPDGERHVRAALGEDVVVLPYVFPGFQLSKRVAEAAASAARGRAMVWTHHGIVTWGETARESYDRMIELVSRAEEYLERQAKQARPLARAARSPSTSVEVAQQRLAWVAPLVRGRLARRTENPDRPFRRVVLRPLVDAEVLDVLESAGARELALSPPLTTDHLIRTRILPAWVEAPRWDDEAELTKQIDEALARYAEDYQSYLARHAARTPAGVRPFAPLPAVVLLPGLGAICAGEDAEAACIARDITAQTLAAKAKIAATGASYVAPGEDHLFDMEYRPMQHAKLASAIDPPLAGQVVLITGAAGAIGSGIAEALLAQGAHMALTDLGGAPLDELTARLGERYPDRVLGVPLDVTDPDSVAQGFARVAATWGGVDAVVINAGLAHVSPLEEMDVDRFRLLERVNTDGTLLLLRESARHLKRQGTGGDVVLVSTKNVFAPGAKFGAYSATKAAAHQLARIASLELAEHDIRVNMVAPDAVFSHGERRSGLWEEVGPDRMRARGLDAAGLEDYYRKRNLLQARITAAHVGRAVAFFLTRATPTTGATIPVDGGLPDATPR